MKLSAKQVLRSFHALTVVCAICPKIAIAQIIADPTLSTGVTTSDNQSFDINAGTRTGTNLFHSFTDFSVPTGGRATFNNSPDIVNIIGRVTGSSSSNIDGLIRANGTANLFLLNPNGIIFGTDAQLEIGGSFIGSTAESLLFEDGSTFNARSLAPNPMLTISTPTGLQLGSTSGSIQVSDTGYLALNDVPLTLDSSASLQVKPGRTLALIGSDLTFTGGMVAAPGGRIELGAVREGVVGLTALGSAFDYSDVERFGDMEFSDQSLAIASDLLFGLPDPRIPFAAGPQGGHIQIQGQNLSFRDGSQALIQNFNGQSSFGSIRVAASGTVELEGEDTSNKVSSGFTTINFNQGRGGAIDISAERLRLGGGALISAEAFQTATGGNVKIQASEAIEIVPSAASVQSGAIRTVTYGIGSAGDINVLAENGDLVLRGGGIASRTVAPGNGGAVYVIADRVALSQGGNIASTTLGAGNGGDVRVDADVITLDGVRPVRLTPSTITASTTNDGNAGNLTINARQLSVTDGGRVDSSTVAAGNAGSVTINASQSVEVSGTVPGSVNPSLIISSANIIDPALRAFLANSGFTQIPAVPTGPSGNLIINTPSLTVRNGARVTVRNDGSGDAGTLEVINADSIHLSNNAGITASTQQGSGGNVVLTANDYLLLRQGSQISAEARGAGDGGNVTLTVPALIALENSDIIANAVQGAGGNIQLNAQTILGTQPRDQLTSESDITASSQFGLSGVVEISSFKVDPSSGVTELPENVSDADNQVAAGCNTSQNNQFIASGRGGLPVSPQSQIESNRPWQDLRDFSLTANASAEYANENRSARTTDVHSEMPESATVEATTFMVSPQGLVTFVAANNSNAHPQATASTCLRNATAQLPR